MELQDELNEEVVTTAPPRSFNYHLIYSILPFVIIIGSLFVGKIVVDYLSRDEAPKIETSITPSPEPSINYPTNTISTPTLQPSLRPTDPIINETQRRYTNGTAGISFLYPKDWVAQGDRSFMIEGNIPSFSVELNLNNKNMAYITHNPYELYWGPVKKTEKINVGGREGELLVTGFCTEEEKKNAAMCDGDTGAMVVSLKAENNGWFFIMHMTNQSEIDATTQRMRDLTSTVKFL
jgi:hypothetical protein